MKDYKRSRSRERTATDRRGGYPSSEKRSFRRDSNESSERGRSDFQRERPQGRFGRDFSKPTERFRGRSEGNFRREYKTHDSEIMHDIVCDKCGKECSVPFKPTSNKPVYCSDCFRKKDDFSQRAGFEPKARANPSSDDLAKINQKLDKILLALKIQ